jgi:hypothetical protein
MELAGGPLNTLSDRASAAFNETLHGISEIARSEESNTPIELDNLMRVVAEKDQRGSRFNSKVVIPMTLLICVLYLGIILLAVVVVLYTIAFHYRTAASRWLFAWFYIFAWFLNLLLVLPVIFLAGIFFFFADLCPNLEESIPLVWNLANISSANLTSMLHCDDDLPLFELGLSTIFDHPGDLLVDLHNHVLKAMEPRFGSSDLGLNPLLTDFSEGNDWSTYLTTDNMLGLPQLPTEPAQAAQDDFTAAVHSYRDLESLQSQMLNLSDFAAKIIPLVANATEAFDRLPDIFLTQAQETINTQLSKLTCKPLRCPYVTLKNAVCVQMYEGIAWWILSTLLFIIASFLMTAGFAWRRRSMMTIVIEPEDSDDPIPELARFAIGKL